MGIFSRFFRKLFGSRSIIVPAGPGDKAFLAGINAYPECPLAGCVNDVKSFRELMIQRFGFLEANVRVITDGDATTANIMDGLRWLSSGANPGDRRYHHFSGHGTQFPNASDVDGMSEVIVPYDFDWTPSKMISDKAYYSIFSTIPKGVVVNWVSDSCHSGDLDRSLVPLKKGGPRFLKPPHEIMLKLAPVYHRRVKLCRSVTSGELDVGFVAACRSDQTASDTEVGGIPCGALSWFLHKKISEMDREEPLSRIVEATRAEMAQAGYEQVPQVEGSRAGRPFLKP